MRHPWLHCLQLQTRKSQESEGCAKEAAATHHEKSKSEALLGNGAQKNEALRSSGSVYSKF